MSACTHVLAMAIFEFIATFIYELRSFSGLFLLSPDPLR